MSRPQDDRNQEATVYLGNLDERCSDALIWELMLQAGPVVNVHLPKDRISMAHQGYGFCEFLTEDDAEYACKIMNQIKLWGKPIRVNKASSDKKQLDVGANLFIGNLDENLDERLLYDTFSAFGILATTAKVARDPTTGKSKGYGFVSYTDFESSDAAIDSMNGQFLMNKAITVQYAFKKDGKGERHGTPAERLLAAQARKNNALPPAARPPPATLNALAAFGPSMPATSAAPTHSPVPTALPSATPTPAPMSAPPGAVPRPPMPVGAPGYGGPPGAYQGPYAGSLGPGGPGGVVPPAPTGFPGVPPMGMGGPPMGMSGSGVPPGMMPMGMPGMPPPPPGYGGSAPGMMPPGMMPQGMGAPPGAVPPPPPGFGPPPSR